jgi:hypothetical protein
LLIAEEIMTQCETCRHVKADGTYCGSPALRDRKYCYYHLMERGRRLRRARALRDNQSYWLEIQSLDNPYAVRAALTDIAQALAAGQLDPRTAGKLLYAIQQVTATNRRIEQMEAAQLEKRKDAQDQPVPQVRARLLGANLGSRTDDHSRVQEYPEFEAQFGLPPGADLDAETDAVLQKAAQEAQLRQSESLPTPPPGLRPGSPADRLFREEAYQILRLQLKRTQHQLRDYNEQKRQQFEKMKKEVLSATPSSQPLADTA